MTISVPVTLGLQPLVVDHLGRDRPLEQPSHRLRPANVEQREGGIAVAVVVGEAGIVRTMADGIIPDRPEAAQADIACAKPPDGHGDLQGVFSRIQKGAEFHGMVEWVRGTGKEFFGMSERNGTAGRPAPLYRLHAGLSAQA